MIKKLTVGLLMAGVLLNNTGLSLVGAESNASGVGVKGEPASTNILPGYDRIKNQTKDKERQWLPRQYREDKNFNIRNESISGEDIDMLVRILTPNSPLYGNGELIKEISRKMGISPLIYISMAKVETNLGTISDYQYRHNLLLVRDKNNNIKEYNGIRDGIFDNIKTLSEIIYKKDLYNYWSFVKVWNPNYTITDSYNIVLEQIVNFLYMKNKQQTPYFEPGFIQEVPDGMIDERISGVYNIEIPDEMLDGFIIEVPDFDEFKSDLVDDNEFVDLDDVGVPKRGQSPGDLRYKIKDFTNSRKFNEEPIPGYGEEVGVFEYMEKPIRKHSAKVGKSANESLSKPVRKHSAEVGKSSNESLSKPVDNEEYNGMYSLITESIQYSDLTVGKQYKIDVVYTASLWEPVDSGAELPDNVETKMDNGKLYKLVEINFGNDGIVYTNYFTPQKDSGVQEITYSIDPVFVDRLMEVAEKYDVDRIQSDIYLLESK